ncbi:MAG: penicillin acylase family protein [Rhodospirillaceae bacterium]|nr:penicillin acylase family protein [Rhodospirillaceae bacterium]
MHELLIAKCMGWGKSSNRHLPARSFIGLSERMIKRVVMIVVLLAVLVMAGGGAWLATSLPLLWPVGDNRIETPDVQKPVKVRRDENGVPHIHAETDTDAYFALGYVHAQDRFWQMEMMRRFGAGRLAEVLGAAALPSDKWMRTLGLYRLAERQAKDLPAPVHAALEAYAKGVNRWLASDMGIRTLELALLRYQPDTWKPADSLLWGKIMALRLGGNWRGEALRAQIAKRIGPEKVAELWPAYPADAPVTIAAADTTLFAGLESLPAWPFGAPMGLLVGSPMGASNVWALAPANSDTGGALLANDPHLGFSAPILWYLAHIDSPGLKLTGATVPGVPFHILGHNKQVAWGITSTQSDIADLFVEKTVEGDGGAYLTPDGSEPFITRDEVIAVKGAAPVPLPIRETRHGPVISDLRPGIKAVIDDDHTVALAATYLQPDDISAAAFYELNRAENWIDFNRALAKFQGPQQNFAYADTAGNIGLVTAGTLPQRSRGEGYVPTAGWTGDTDWTGIVPFAELPKLYKPTNDIIINANNRIVAPDFRHFLGYDWAAPYRAQRIQELLDDNDSRTATGQQRIQRDVRSRMAADLLPLMLVVKTESAINKKAVALLGKWNGVMARSKPEPLIFMAWLLELNRALYADDLGELTSSFLGSRALLVKSILTHRQHWCDDVRTEDAEETCAEILVKSLNNAMKRLSKEFGKDMADWRWGAAHRARFSNPVLGRIPVVDRFVNLEIESDGGNATINRGAMRLNDPVAPFTHIHGAGFRAVYDLKDLKKSRFGLATGQSGNPLSRHYRDQLDNWRRGRMFRISASRGRSSDSAGFILEPAKK